ncbi:protein-tyrosine sulfotransferase [Selaginella moellendorffii]|nr:protein-tyrosine sulfotransferase [Selaginella moellendorffii]|eukprot:XP_002984138.2 protein-tyrosine sulfotransferase [Selaginella moellendorffii]
MICTAHAQRSNAEGLRMRKALASSRWWHWRWRSLSALLLWMIIVAASGSSENPWGERERCEALVRRWAGQEIWNMEEESGMDLDGSRKWELQDLLFFLHVPRTGGRNYNQCFLKNMFSSEELCPRSYDKLRMDLSKPNCSLLSTHDDYSILSMLPKARTSTITNIRDPMNRVLSSYEFSVEVAARFLRRTRSMLRRIGPKTQKAMSTLDIWPWKYLVPLLQRDLFERRDLRAAHLVEQPQKPANVYDVPAFVMPLKEFVDHPAVHELVHNGQTFQVAGITNNSYLKEANDIRYCVTQFEELGEHVLHVAKRRLNGMLYVGLTERHKESAEILVHLVGRQIATRNLHKETSSTAKQTATYPDYGLNMNLTAGNDTSYGDFISHMVTSYEQCSSSLRNAQVQRRIMSLETIAPVNFSKEARKTIPGDTVARILQLNSLDFELYQHAKQLFQLEQEFLKNHADELETFEPDGRHGLEEHITSLHATGIVGSRDAAAYVLEEDRNRLGVTRDAAIFILGCSVVLSALGIYSLVNFLSRSARAKSRGATALQRK